MERIISLIFLCTAFEGDIGKHIFVPISMTWHDAQAFCRAIYTDLSFIRSQSDQDKLRTATGQTGQSGWIGLYRDTTKTTAWRWSGGGYVTYQNWEPGQPDNHNNNENNAYLMSNGNWNDENGDQLMPFYCISLAVEREKLSWESAWTHCRESQTNLISLLSESEHRWAQEVFQTVNITERVWIGLRYLDERWLWVNGDPLVYEAWPQGGDQGHQCPLWKRCGALTRGALWENWDCQEKLNFICI